MPRVRVTSTSMNPRSGAPTRPRSRAPAASRRSARAYPPRSARPARVRACFEMSTRVARQHHRLGPHQPTLLINADDSCCASRVYRPAALVGTAGLRIELLVGHAGRAQHAQVNRFLDERPRHLSTLSEPFCRSTAITTRRYAFTGACFTSSTGTSPMRHGSPRTEPSSRFTRGGGGGHADRSASTVCAR